MFKKIILIIILGFMLTACGSLIKVNRLDVQQGNVLTVKQIKTIHRGMTQQRVIDRLGQPVLTDVFHPEQLIYVYSWQPGYGKLIQKHVIFYFSSGRLTHYETNVDLVNGKIPQPGIQDQS